MTDSIEPASTQLEALYRASRSSAGPSLDQTQRLLSQLDTVIGLAAPAAATAVTTPVATSVVRRALPWLLSFAAGAGTGGLAVRAAMAPPEPAPVVDRAPVLAPREVTPVPTVEHAVTPAPAPREVPPAPAPIAERAPTHPRAPAASSLDEERSLLEPARTALVRGNAGPCLEALARHLARFPRGALAEEREALAVQALVADGQPKAAQARAAQFKSTFPDSLLLPVVEAAMQSIR